MTGAHEAGAPAPTSLSARRVTVVFPILGQGKGAFEEAGEGMAGAGHVVRDGRGRATGIYALRDLSLELRRGDRLGLIGKNGSGKSTLLRTLAGVYPPYEGEVRAEGRIAGLFNVGLGMRADASGMRNIELSGLVAGFTRDQVREMTPRIAAFTELGDYLRMPVRTYSNGMAMRLRFACATAYDPDILLMDEWLGAGDPDFQQKAQDRMRELVERTGIMVLASHNHAQIASTCTKAAWLHRGRLAAFGPTDEVIACAEGRMDPEELFAAPAEPGLTLVTRAKVP